MSKKGEWGLGVCNLKAFNLALLGKWCWRLINNRDDLLFKVLCSKYGSINESVGGGAKKASTW